MRTGSDGGYEMQLGKLLYSGNNQKQPLEKSSKTTGAKKKVTVKHWKNISTEY